MIFFLFYTESRSNLSSLTATTDERPLRFTDSYLTSTISTTSGLGSNYTTNTSGSSNTQATTTPSPRHKTSATSFHEVAELPEQELNEEHAQFYGPAAGNYFDHRLANTGTSHYFKAQNYDDNLIGHRNVAYFGELFHCNAWRFWVSNFKF